MYYCINECQLYGYADDNTLSKAAHDVESLTRSLESDAASTLSWFENNHMCANPDKFQAIVLGMKNPETLNFQLGNITIKPEDKVRLLGIDLDSKLNFNCHIHEICQKAARQINALKRLSKFLTLESRMAIFRSFIMSNFNYCSLVWQNLERVNTFKYLGATLAENGDLDAEMTHRIQSGWKNWKRVSGILCDRRISLRVKGKVYKTVVRPAMMYGAETWAVKKTQEKKLDVAEMRMLRWMSGVTKLDRIRNERIRGTTKVGEISKKVQESRLKWYGHVLRREEEYVGKRVMAMEVPGKRRRGRPKRRWMDTIGNDLSEKELSREDTQDRAKWRSLIRHIDPT